MCGTGSTAAANHIGARLQPAANIIGVTGGIKVRSKVKDAIGLLVACQIPILGDGLKRIGIASDIIRTGCGQLRQGVGNALRWTAVDQKAAYRQIRQKLSSQTDRFTASEIAGPGDNEPVVPANGNPSAP